MANAAKADPRLIRPEWLARRHEEILEPELPIIDTHHHMREDAGGGQRFMFEEVLADVRSGHKIVATVFMQSGTRSRAFYRPYGDPAFAPVGETEVINGVAAMSASGAYGPTRICAGIISYADMRLGAKVGKVLEAHIRAGGDRLRGIRDSMTWDASTEICPPTEQHRKGILTSSAMREALACFAPLGLMFEMWVYHPQMNEAIAVMRDFPDTHFVLNHLGGPLHTAPSADHGAERFAAWRTAIRAVAQLPNVVCKLGGIGMHFAGFNFHMSPEPPSSKMLCDAWRPYIETCIEAFGAGRCMVESNFPVDKAVCSYAVLWNAFKRMVSGASTSEKAEVFSGTARRVYRLAGADNY